RARGRAVLPLQGGGGPAHTRGRDRDRLQRRERELWPDAVRGARRRVQGRLRGAAPLRRRGRDRGLEAPHGPLRSLPADPLGVLRRRLGAHLRPLGQGDEPTHVAAPAPALRRAEPVRRRPAPRWSRLLTEQRNARSRRLDTLSTRRVVALLLDEDARAIRAAALRSAAVARAAERLAR